MAKSFIVDIRQGFKYSSDERNKLFSFQIKASLKATDERNKLFSFQIKATLKATTLGIRMCCTELSLQKNQKSLTCYPITLFKRDSTADIFLEKFNFFWTSYFKK